MSAIAPRGSQLLPSEPFASVLPRVSQLAPTPHDRIPGWEKYMKSLPPGPGPLNTMIKQALQTEQGHARWQIHLTRVAHQSFTFCIIQQARGRRPPSILLGEAGVAVPAGWVTGLLARRCWVGTKSDPNNCVGLLTGTGSWYEEDIDRLWPLSCWNRAGCGHRQVRGPLGGRASVWGQANPTPPSPPGTRIPRGPGPEQTKAKLRAIVLKLWCLGI